MAQPTVPPSTIITRTRYPKWWDDSNVAAINLPGPGSQTIIPPGANQRTFVTCVVFTVSAETNVSLHFGDLGYSGSMDFGGSDEPRGIVIDMGASPAPCGRGSFSITSDGEDASVQGFAVYTRQPV